MKNRPILFPLIVLLFALSPLTVFAQSIYVHDNAELMSDSEIGELENLAYEISRDTGLNLVVLTVDSIGSYSAEGYADNFYDLNGYSDDGMLFMLAMQERDWYVSTCGIASEVFSGHALDAILDIGLPYFSDGAYYDGFCQVLNAVPYYMDSPAVDDLEDYTPVRNHNIVHEASSRSGAGAKLMLSILIGAAVGGIALLIMRSMMNTKRKQRSAVDYMTQGSYQLRTRQDIFLYSHVSKTPRQQNNSSGSGSNHRSSSGRTHGGGGRKF